MVTIQLPVVPAGWEELSKAARAVVLETVEKFFRLVVDVMSADVPKDPGQLLDEETGLHQRTARECVDPVIAARIQAAHEDPKVLEEAEWLARTGGFLPQKSTERVTITLLGGSALTLRTPYFLRRPRGGRKKKGRGASGNGVYPVLATLGIHFRATPALASEVGRLVAQGTLEEARQNLAVRGVRLGLKRIQGLARKLAARGLSYREWSLQQARGGRRGDGQALRGKRLAIAMDGGRIRVRVPIKLGRRRKSGRRGFDGAWKEPKVLVVYELDGRGRKRARGLVRYDATMEDCNRLFDLLMGLLCEIGAQEAAEWVFLADGADWIWNRIPELVKAVGFKGKVTEVVDFYHAVERLHKIAAEMKGWNAKERTQWVGRMKRILRRGEAEKIYAERTQVRRGPGSKAVRQLFDYFETHKERMRYGDFKRRRIPLGSGGVESAVRRIVNLRMKGNGIFWLLENAEGVLHLRSQLLSGRWNEFVRSILDPKAGWAAETPTESRSKRAA
jgi:hypothetical protein